MPADVYEIGSWRLDVGGGLFRGDARAPLAPKELETLRVLVENAGRVVTRDDLVAAVWPDVAVTEASLTRCVYLLRAKLGDEGERYIETVPRRGYRFVGPVRRIRTAGDAASEPLRLGVLAFEAAGAAPEPDPLLEGLASEVTARLSRLHGYGLAVVTRHATAHLQRAGRSLPEIGQELRLDYLLTGSARLDDDELWVRAELVRVSDLAQVWTESFERPLAVAQSVQAELAASIASRLPLRLPGIVRSQLSRVYAAEPRVYESYLRARHHWSQRGGTHLAQAVDLWNRILEWDPGFAPAHVGLASSYLMMTSWYQMTPMQARTRVRNAIQIALEIDPDLAAAHAVLGDLQSLVEWDFAGADASFRRALALDPADPDVRFHHARHLLAAGRAKEAIDEAERALDVDPYAVATRMILVLALFAARRFDDALAEARSTVGLDPAFPWSLRNLAMVASYQGRHDEARDAVELARRLAPEDPGWLNVSAYVHARAGRREEARRENDEYAALAATRWLNPSLAAAPLAALGETDAALRWLERAADHRCNWLAASLHDPRLDPLRDEPRFRAIVRRVRG